MRSTRITVSSLYNIYIYIYRIIYVYYIYIYTYRERKRERKRERERERERLNHLLFMDDLKLHAKSETELVGFAYLDGEYFF